jgi:hypothetical protein
MHRNLILLSWTLVVLGLDVVDRWARPQRLHRIPVGSAS